LWYHCHLSSLVVEGSLVGGGVSLGRSEGGIIGEGMVIPHALDGLTANCLEHEKI
jgi:hypothetical protein